MVLISTIICLIFFVQCLLLSSALMKREKKTKQNKTKQIKYFQIKKNVENIKSEMRFILTSKSWSFAINRAATVAEVVVVAAAAVDQAVAIVTIIVAVEIVITVIWDRVQCIMATMAVAVEAATIGTIAEILTCQTYNR